MSYIALAVSLIAIFAALSAILYLQSSLSGIMNFGIVGFWGLGMYTFSIFVIKLEIPFVLAILITMVFVGIVALALGRILLNLGDQAVLVGTLAFATIIENLATSEKWLTNGVIGLGTIKMPFRINDSMDATALVYAVIIIIIVAALFLYAAKVKKTPYGRLLQSIKDNEPLSQSLGKPTFWHKIIFFSVTCALLGLFGALTAPLYMHLYPFYIGQGITFTIWIALLIGGRTKVSGAVVGVLATVGLFNYLIESLVKIPPDVKYVVYGVALVLVFMFRPNGIVASSKRKG